VDGSARWACAAGSWLGLERARAGNKSWAELGQGKTRGIEQTKGRTLGRSTRLPGLGLKVRLGRKGRKRMKKQMNFFLFLEFIFGKRII
jgi:hypothetical protein